MGCTEDAVEFFLRREETGEAGDGKRFIVKPAVYDPKARTEILFLPIPDKQEQYEAVLELNRGIGKAMNLTGQFTLDLMHKSSGELVPIECNPRIHSAVCTLEGHKNLGAVFTDPNFSPSEEDAVK